ncbi:MAG: hypothetical protein HND52_11160 [Ignavibacteriae bacterium]|nr:hypothetical protein [Ignavibacteriota bacterium]NOG98506.1 hypothetical protein [Ignavibacteriota bacterium]
MKKRYYVDDLLSECRNLYNNKGISTFLYKNIDKKLYFRLYQNGLTLSDVIKKLDLECEFKHYKLSIAKWNWTKLIEEIKPIVKKQNFLPPASWFQNNNKSHLIQALYSLGKNWDDLRKEFNSYENSSFVISRNKLRWRSHPEASLSNFLFSRGIKHCKGKKYPPEYSVESKKNYGYYDLQFVTRNKDKINVEIWGDRPHGHAEIEYEKTKKLKLNFNENKKNFLGVHFSDCYNEKVLENILKKYIGIITPFNFEKPYDEIIPTTHWSNADELILYCKNFAQKMPNGIFPTEEWLRKRGKWKHRDGEAYNTLSIYIKTWIGGIRKLRKILGQPENSTRKWNEKNAVKEYENIFNKYNLTTGQLRGKLRRKQMFLSEKEKRLINNVDSAVRKHYGSISKLNAQLGIKY